MGSSSDLVRYDAMVFAITECHRVDEVKDIRDKALALELLQASDHTFMFPAAPGVYVFDGINGTLYVGESRNLKQRLANHEKKYLRRSVGVRCRIIKCSNHKHVEKWLISELKPSLNKVLVHHRMKKPPNQRGVVNVDTRSFDDLWNTLFL